MFPAAIAIVVVTFDLRSRGRALALFFGIAGGADRDRPDRGRVPDRVDLAGDLLDQHPGRPDRAGADRHLQAGRTNPGPAPMDYRGLALIVGGVGLSVFGFQQSALWGWGNPAIWASIAVGVLLLVVFFSVERRTESPLINVRIFAQPDVPGGEHHPRRRHDGVHPGVLLRRHLRADRPGREGHHRQPAHLVLLPRLRGLRADRRPDAGPDRGQAAGGARLRAGRRRVRAVGRQGHRPARRRPGHLHRHGRGRHGADARARPTPTRSTGPPGTPTARPPASPRPSATTAPASASPSWARS